MSTASCAYNGLPASADPKLSAILFNEDQMMAEIKYVMVDIIKPILFPKMFQHSDFAHLPVTSAGMVRIYRQNDEIKVETYGESISLDMRPAGSDADIIARVFGFKRFDSVFGKLQDLSPEFRINAYLSMAG